MRVLWLIAAVAVTAAAAAYLFGAGTAMASTYSGNNSWTFYRLPWAHGQSHPLMQSYDTCNLRDESGAFGDHCGSQLKYSLDFSMSSGTPILSITEGYACVVTDPNNQTGLGIYVSQTAPGALGRGGTDYYFYGHNSSSWISACGQGSTYLYQGQIASWSGNTGHSVGPHLHIGVQNPGNQGMTGSSVVFASLSGIGFGGFSINTNCCPADYFVSDSVMPGDDQTVPQPGFYSAIFNKWSSAGGLNIVGSTRNNGGGPGVHGWGNGVVQDFAGQSGPNNNGTGAVMLKNFTGTAWYVHNVIWPAYIAQGGATGWIAYPISDEFFWFYYYGVPIYRQNFDNGCMWYDTNTYGVNNATYAYGTPCYPHP